MTMAKTIEPRFEPADNPGEVKASGISKMFMTLAVLLSLAAAGISVMVYQQLKQTRFELSQLNGLGSDNVSARISSVNEQMEQLSAAQQTFQAQLMTEQENFHSRARQQRAETEAMTRKLEISNQQLLQSMDVLFRQKGREHFGWILAEVEYLLLIANHSLQLQGDVNTAITALQQADDRLLNSGDPGSIEIRMQINEEIEQLKALEQTDIVQLAAKLSGSIKMIKQLPVHYTQMNAEEKAAQIAADKATHDAGNFAQAGKDFLKELQKLVILRQTNKPAQPMITPREQFFLQQNLQLKLETARYALLSGKQGLYSNSLEEAIHWLETYYDIHVNRVALMIEGLKSLQEATIAAPSLPNISHSINLLRAYQKEIGQNSSAATNAAVSEDEVK